MYSWANNRLPAMAPAAKNAVLRYDNLGRVRPTAASGGGQVRIASNQTRKICAPPSNVADITVATGRGISRANEATSRAVGIRAITPSATGPNPQPARLAWAHCADGEPGTEAQAAQAVDSDGSVRPHLVQ